MRLVIGGKYQGKLDWLCREMQVGPEQAAFAQPGGRVPEGCCILAGLQDWVRLLLEEGKDPQQWMEELLSRQEDWAITCDEIGCGVVPLKPEERRWREETGRLCCWLARRARRVDRVFCGIPQTIKEERA